MRTKDEIRADWDIVENSNSGSDGLADLAEERLYTDIPDLLNELEEQAVYIAGQQDALAEKDERIQDLEGVLSGGQEVLCAQNATIGNLREENERLQAALIEAREPVSDAMATLIAATLQRGTPTLWGKAE